MPYFGLKKYENGPTGPKFKHLVRKGLFPDEPEKPNLMKTLVRWYMSMYGSYLKGWNPWVVIVFVVLVLVVTICLMVFVVRRIGPLMKDWCMNLRKRRRWQDDEAQDSEVHLGLLAPAEPKVEEEEDEP